MYKGEEGYLQLLNDIIVEGVDRGDRTGTGTRSIFSAQIEFDLQESFPLLTTKKMATKAIFGELLWFLDGKSDLASLRRFTFGDENSTKKTIWDDNIKSWDSAQKWGGYLYGKQWRGFCGLGPGSGPDAVGWDQIHGLLEDVRRNPESRRLIVNAWNAAEINHDMMALPPCHFAFQVYIEKGYLNLKFSMRSSDVFLGLPFNIASYAALTHILADWLGYKLGKLIGDLTNVHIYQNHFEAVREQLSREVLDCKTKLTLPEGMTLDNLHEYTASDFTITGYDSHPAIKAPMAV